jgi:hypothetical protein
MKPETLNHINLLNSPDAFITKTKKIDALPNPIIIIGLGGTGIDALVHVKYLINKSFKHEGENKTPNNVVFLGIDTDNKALNKSREGISLDASELFVCKDTISALLTNPARMTGPMREFVHPHLKADFGAGTGAGGIRQAGRIMLFNNIDNIGRRVQEIVHRITTGNSNPPLVYILSGLGGGTGSGTFIDMGFFLRGAIEKEIHSFEKPLVFGYIFLPDVNATAKDVPAEVTKYVEKNGYAALKELDYLMGIKARGETFDQEYSGAYNYSVPENPFTYVQLISSKNSTGVSVPSGYDYAMNVVAESIVDYISNGDIDPGTITTDGHYANVNTIANEVNTEENKRFPGDCRYIALGSAAMRLPTEEIMMYLASLIFNKMDGMFSNIPKDPEVDGLAQRLGIDNRTLEASLMKNIRETLSDDKNTAYYNYDNVIKSGKTNIESELRSGYQRQAEITINASYDEIIGGFKDRVDSIFAEIFTDPKKGPIFANKAIIGSNGLLNKVKHYKTAAQTEIDEAENEDIKRLRIEANMRYEEARKALFGKDEKKNAYIDAMILVYKKIVGIEARKKMLDAYIAIERVLREKNDATYTVVTEILEKLKEIFRHNEEIVLKTSEKIMSGSRTYYWNVVEVPALAPEIREYVNGLDTEKLIADFTNKLLRDMNYWITDNVNIVDFIQDFLETEFSGIVQLSLEEVLKRDGKKKMEGKTNGYILQGSDDDGEFDIEGYVRSEIAPKLLDMSRALFPIVPGEGFLPSEAIMISVPGDPACRSIYNALAGSDKSWAGGARVTIKKSAQNDRITITNCTCGLPLYRYAELEEYEKAYWKVALEPDAYGRHLRQGNNENWIDLPSPIPQQFWPVMNSYYNEEIAKINRQNSELFDAALTYPIIVRNPDAKTGDPAYECRVTVDDFDAKDLMRQNGVILEDAADNAKAKRVLSQLKGIMKSGLELARDPKTNRLIKHTLINSTDEDKAKISFMRAFDLIKLIKVEVAKYQRIQEIISELEEWLAEGDKTKEKYRQFAQVLYTNTLPLNPDTMVYTFDVTGDGANVIDLLDFVEAGVYPEYSLLLQTIALPDHQQKAMYQRATDKIVTLKSERNTFIAQLKSTLTKLEKSQTRVSADQHNISDAATILSFYEICIASVSGLLDQIADIDT